MEKIKSDPPPPLSLREVLPVIDYTGRLYPKKEKRVSGKGIRRGFSFHVKTTKSVSRGKRFDVVWEPPSMKLPWDCS